MAEAKASDKPVMMVIHTSWCGNCKALKPRFKQAQVTELSEQFVMVNVDQDKVQAAQRHAPDGTYIPRILFFDPSGEFDKEIKSGSNPQFSYFYSPIDDLSVPMKKALARHGKKG